MSIRVFTDEQFADGTTMDGNRLEAAMQALEERLDTVPDGDVENRWMQTQIVAGWAPITIFTGSAASEGAHPWLRIYNTLSDEFGSHTTTLSQNAYRLKGTKVDGIDASAYSAIASATQYAFTQSIQLTRPSIIYALDLFLMQDTVGSKEYDFGNTDTTQDIDIQISVDNPWSPEDRTQADMEIHKYNFSDTYWQFNTTVGAATTDMQPAFPGGNNKGIAVNLSNLGIPIHKDSRVRISVTIPRYSSGSKQTKWTDAPWKISCPNLTLSLLEPLADA